MVELTTAILIAAAYLLGAVPFAYLFGKIKGKDVSKIGSRNIGALNAWRQLGWRIGSTVLILDTAKGAVVMAIILAMNLTENVALAMATAVTLGHNFSIFLKFNGGKGVAVVFGLSLVIFPLLTVLAVAVIPIAFYITRSLSWSFLAGFVALNALTIATNQPAAQVGLCIILSAIVVLTHLLRTRQDMIPAFKKLDLRSVGKIE